LFLSFSFCFFLNIISSIPFLYVDLIVLMFVTEGDDVTVKVHMERLISWNLTDSNAGKALSVGGWFYPLNDELESA